MKKIINRLKKALKSTGDSQNNEREPEETKEEADEQSLILLAANEIQQRYPIAEGQYKLQIISLLVNIKIKALKMGKDSNHAWAVENALYCAASRMGRRNYEQENNDAYLTGLLKDIENGQYEYRETNYSSEYANEVFMELKLSIIALLNQ